MKNTDPMVIFVRVAEAKNFSKVGERLGISASGVSKAISRYEADLGVKLINRTTRSVSLTEEGYIFFHRCREILADIEDARAAVAKAKESVRGRLRVQVPIGLGRRIILPALPGFLEKHPELVIDVELNDRVVNLAEEGLDLVVAVGPQPDSHLISRKLGDAKFVTCASPDYLARHGEPRTPAELETHRCLAYLFPRTGRYREWRFIHEGQELAYPLSGPLNCSSSQTLLDLAVNGAGIANVASFIAAEAVEAGKLKLILEEYRGVSLPVTALYMPSRHMSQRVRTFLNLLAESFPQSPPWDRILEEA